METFDFRLTTTATVLDICLVQVASMLYKRIQNEITAVKDTENAKWEDGLKKQRRQHKTDHTALYQMYSGTSMAAITYIQYLQSVSST
jgi:hypothetical protein